MVKKVEIIGNLEGSDHQMLEWVTLINLRQCEYQGTTKDYSKANYNGIKDRLRHMDWENILNIELEQCPADFTKLLHEAVDQFMSASIEFKTDAGDMAEELNNYFISVFTKEDINNLPQDCSPLYCNSG